MEKALKERYFELERNHWWFVVRGSIIKDFIAKKVWKGKSLKILNVGCATGKTSEILQSFGHVQSVEYDEYFYKICENILKIDIIQASITSLPFEDNMFDLVCAFDVIEHVEDDHKAVNELIRVCKNEGHVFITVPAYMSLWSEHDTINQHFRRYNSDSLKGLFSKLKGEVIYFTFFNSLLFPFINIVRMSRNVFRKKNHFNTNRSDLEILNHKWINQLLKNIFSLERLLLRILTFPFGVSISLTWKKG